MNESTHTRVFTLTEGQKQILELLEQGLSVSEICTKLGKTRIAVKRAVQEIRDKRRAGVQ